MKKAYNKLMPIPRMKRRILAALFACIFSIGMSHGTQLTAAAATNDAAGAVAAPDLLPQANVPNVPLIVERIDGIAAFTDANTYANNSWQLMKEEADGQATVVRASEFDIGSDVANLCREYGYNEGVADFYYDNPDASGERFSAYGPICIKAEIDDVKYTYYFVDNQLIRRIGPEGVQDKPQTNAFLNRLYKLGVEDRKPGLIVKTGTFEWVNMNRDDTTPSKDRILVRSDLSAAGYFVIDSNTELVVQDGSIFSYPDSYHGESAVAWYIAMYNKSLETPPFGGIFLVYANGNHIDYIYDCYWPC